MRKLKYLLFLFIVFIVPNVFATSVNVSNKIKYDTDTATGTYKGDEIALGGSNTLFSIGTRYNGRLSLIEFYLSSNDYNFIANRTYTITLNMATNDWRNNFMSPQVIKANSDGSFQTVNQNLVVSSFSFVSRKQIKFNFKTNSTLSPYLFFRLYSTDYATNNTVAITGDNNWLLSSIYIEEYTTGSGSGNTGSGSTITNTNLTCSNGLTLSTKNFNVNDVSIPNVYLNSSGNTVSNSSYGIITYIPISPNTNYVISKTTNTGDVPSYCLSSSTSSYGTCVAYDKRSSIAFNSGSSTYLSFSIRIDETATLGTCVSPIDNANQNTQDIINNQNQNTQKIEDTLTDSNVDNGVGSDFFNNFSSRDFGLSQIITLPLTTIQGLANTSCVSLNIPIPFTNSTIPLPCMTQVYQTYIPTIFNIWQVVSFGIIAYFICIDIVHLVKGFKDPDSDKVEVLDL